MPIYVPKQIVPIQPPVDAPLFFLAGPILGGGDWQGHMAEHIINRLPYAHIACPVEWDKEHWLSRHFHTPFTPTKTRTLDWEEHYLVQTGLHPSRRGCVIFWLPVESTTKPHPGPGPYAMDTRRELGKFTAYAEMVKNTRFAIGGDRKFHGLDTILYGLHRATGQEFPFHETMSEVVDAAFAIAKEARIQKVDRTHFSE